MTYEQYMAVLDCPTAATAEDIFSPEELAEMEHQHQEFQAIKAQELAKARAALMRWGDLVSEVPFIRTPRH